MPPRQVLFYRDFKRFTGGHLQVWHYFQHLRSTDRYLPQVVFAAGSRWDASNPWYVAGTAMPTALSGAKPDLLFLGGLDWEGVAPLLQADPHIPVVNLLQGFAHAKPEHARFGYLSRPALRICVSEGVRDAVAATGAVNGPLYVVPNGMDRSELPPPLPDAQKDIDLLVVASKHPGMSLRLERRLQGSGLRSRFLRERLPRAEFHEAIRHAQVTVFLPHKEEGFYLPALEGMALETLVICPDCVGNRSFCLPGVNSLRPEYTLEALLAALDTARHMAPEQRTAMREQARVTVARHDLMAERRAFLEILDRM